MILREIVDVIAGVYKKELDHVFKQQVETMIIAARSEIIRRHYDKYGVLPSSLIQQINCTPTVKTDITECCSLNIGCNVIKTVETIPSPIRNRMKESNFHFVGTIDNSKTFSYIKPEQLEFYLSEPTLKHKTFYSYINSHIYLFNTKSNVNNIRVRGIFNDPRIVNGLNDCDNNPSDCEEIDIPEDFIVGIKDLVYRQLPNSNIPPMQEEIKTEETIDG